MPFDFYYDDLSCRRKIPLTSGYKNVYVVSLEYFIEDGDGKPHRTFNLPYGNFDLAKKRFDLEREYGRRFRPHGMELLGIEILNLTCKDSELVNVDVLLGMDEMDERY